MNQDNGGIAGETTVSLMLCASPADGHAACSLWKAAANLEAGRNGLKDCPTRCEVEAFLSLAPGHRIVFMDHETGVVRRGVVDVTYPERAFVWVVTDLGERKLLDIAVHTVWRPGARQICGSQG
ncbi:hypothetical protein [Arthrobacter sp. I3]|jgi:hypothetical protein|uniref:hypothetical protein n=1 Tax=Arthrobacter sp. I3 TaxID=218158 RepID=UPI0012EC0567|nr:hypothetical protein [Arthrobacter sp. I3]